MPPQTECVFIIYQHTSVWPELIGQREWENSCSLKLFIRACVIRTVKANGAKLHTKASSLHRSSKKTKTKNWDSLVCLMVLHVGRKGTIVGTEMIRLHLILVN